MSQQVIDEIQNQLSQVSILTELADGRASDFFGEVKKWMKAVESIFITNKIAAGAQIATYRANLISVDHDGLIPEGLAFYRNPSRIKLKRACATVFMQKTVEVIYNYLLQISVALGDANRG